MTSPDRMPPALLLLAVLSAGCGQADPGADRARAAFVAFQEALLRRDADALRRLVCLEGRPAVPELCARVDPARPPLRVTSVTRRRGDWLVHVTDPDRGGAASHFVVCAERGAMRVDLLATWGDHTTTTRQVAGRPQLELQRLDPAQVRQAQARRGNSDPRDAAAPR